jgi:hypothetical protein
MRHYTVKEYDSSTVKDLKWPDTDDARYCRKFVDPMFAQGISPYIGNVDDKITRLKLLHIIPAESFEEDQDEVSISPDEIVLPITVNIKEDYERYNCFTASPYHHFITYGRDELYLNPIHPIIKFIMELILTFFSFFFKLTHLERVIIVNNWMLSTNLSTNLNPDQIEAITTYLCAKYPSHTIIFRSINDSITNDLLLRFYKTNYLRIPSRMVYVIDSRDEKAWKVRSMQQDLKVIFTLNYLQCISY